MNNIKKLVALFMAFSLANNVVAEGLGNSKNLEHKYEEFVSLGSKVKEEKSTSIVSNRSRLSFGGYGEAVMTRNFYSDKYMRYTDAKNYKNDKSHGRFDLPHVVFWMGYDFGKGWSLGTEVEFEHGGTGSAVEVEAEESGEYESEIEKGGEVALEQFWIQKSFSRALNLKMGHIIVPVGATNMHHTPNNFFTNYRPEGEYTIMPCTWHETGVSLWGKFSKWRYELMFVAGLDAHRFGSKTWIKGGSGGPYEFKIANSYAGAFRLDNYSFNNLRLSVSGYVGNSFKNTLSATDSKKIKDVKGTVAIGAFDFCYNNNTVILRGNFDYGYLSDSQILTKYNMSMRKDSPSPKEGIASAAIATGIEAGYDVFALSSKLSERGHKFYLFGRYEYYDSMFKTDKSVQDMKWCKRQRIAAGFNYCPNKNVIVKGEYSLRLFDKKYNNEPSISLGVAYTGLFR